MITPIATVVFAAAMALSLSVEGSSFFHEPVTTTSDGDDAAPPAPTEDDALGSTVDGSATGGT